jgi:hypothetical protein
MIRKMCDVSEQFRMLHDALSDLLRLPGIVTIMKSRRLRWAEYVTGAGKKTAYGIWMENIHLEDLEGDGKIALKRFLRR